MIILWTNFVKLGDPTPPDSGLSWNPVQAGMEHEFFNISGTQPVMDAGSAIKRRMDFWDSIMKI